MVENGFKKALLANRTQIGLWATLSDAYAIEILASNGFDWLAIDAEHSPNDLRSILTQLQACAAYGVQCVVRLPLGDPILIKQYLDIGAHTLLIPMVETAKEARQLVAAARYPPQGIRGMSAGRASVWGAVEDYFQHASDLVCMLVQVETVTGLENLAEIAAVEGIDGVFIGPSDLSASMGYLAQPGHPEVVKTIEGAIATIRAAGKGAGILTADTDLAQFYIAQGVNFCAVGIDIALLLQATRGLLQKFRPETKEVLRIRPKG